jgi:pyruvate dehydrogenase E2 component (dihydrolipoamide acetyltransferase)
VARAIVMPSFGMYTLEGTVVRWLKPSGAAVAASEAVLELETEKALADVVAPESGILHHVVAPGSLVQVESLLGYILAPGEQPPANDPPVERELRGEPRKGTLSTPTHEVGQASSSPNARRVAADLGVDLNTLVGTGPGGRITEEDVRAAAVDNRG